MPVAKSYQKYKITTEPFYESGRPYVMIKTDAGERKVRWYSDEQYRKMYGEMPKPPVSLKETMGFGSGTVAIFKGDTYKNLDWFKSHRQAAKYHPLIGWSFSIEALPEQSEIPADLQPIPLNWSDIATGDNTLKSEDEIKALINSFIYDEGTSQYVGTVGDRAIFYLTVKKVLNFENYYGYSSMHIMEDADGNEFVWTTSARTLEEGVTYKVRGTIKQHKIYKNNKQTVLSRCTVERI